MPLTITQLVQSEQLIITCPSCEEEYIHDVEETRTRPIICIRCSFIFPEIYKIIRPSKYYANYRNKYPQLFNSMENDKNKQIIDYHCEDSDWVDNFYG